MNRFARNVVRQIAGTIAGALLLTACVAVDSPTAPGAVAQTPSVSPAALAPLVVSLNAKLLGRPLPLNAAITVTATIGKTGGSISIPNAGFTLVVPPGAVSSNVQFSVTALAGSAYAYDFAPHGIVFSVPLTFQQTLSEESLLLGATLKGGYFANGAQVDTWGLKAALKEVYGTKISNGCVTFDIQHFSGYLVSMA